MQQVLSGFPWRKVIVYIDDVLILGEDFEEHVDLVSRVLATLSDSGVTLNLSKCKWFEKEVEFLGHIVSERGLGKPASYVQQVVNFPKPATKTELRRFLGLVNFQRKFIENCSQIMKPLSVQTGGSKNKKSRVEWSEEMDRAFEQLKVAMAENTILAYPNYDDGEEPLCLFTDASQVGVGACLSQRQCGHMRPIAYASMTFNKAQESYSTLERELAAMRWAVKIFRGFLLGVEFEIHTDHKPLVYLQNMQIVNARLARTLQELSEFTFVIKYVPGKDNLVADAMSRLSDSNTGHIRVNVSLPVGLKALPPVPGGGDSMLESLLGASDGVVDLGNFGYDALTLRQKLIEDILGNPQKYLLRPSKDLTRKLKLMRHAGQLPCTELIFSIFVQV